MIQTTIIDNIVNWGKLHMSSKQTCICLIHSVWTKFVFAKTKVQWIITTYGSTLKLRNACCWSL